jgi:hypothetical protein
MGTQTDRVTAIGVQTRSYHSSGNGYYRPAYTKPQVVKVNSVMTGLKSLSSVLNGIPTYMVSSNFAEKFSLKA